MIFLGDKNCKRKAFLKGLSSKHSDFWSVETYIFKSMHVFTIRTSMSDIKKAQEPDLSKIKAFIFDLDGTLVKSAIDFHRLKQETLQHLRELSIETGDLSENMKTYEIVSHLREREMQGKLELPYSLVLAEIASVWDRVELENVDRTEKIPGVDEALRLIRNRGGRVGVITRGCRTYAIEALRRVQLLSFIDTILARDDTEESKPSPEPLLMAMSILGVEAHETIMVGDTVEDAVCAQRAGVFFIGVSTRLSDQAALMELGNVKIFESLRGLLLF